MYGENNQDYALAGIDYEPDTTPLDFRIHGIKDFGIYADQYGITDSDELPTMYAEATPFYRQNSDGGTVELAWTPALEIHPRDHQFLRRYRRPYHGMVALGDDGQAYQYDGLEGFFKKLFKKVKKGIKKIAGGIKKGVKAVGKIGKKLISKLPGGKYLLKLGSKVWAISKKLVRPLTKFLGKYSKKLAGIAAFIPGYGPAIAGALLAAGKVAQIMNKTGAVLKGKPGEIRKVKFPSGEAAKKFKKELRAMADREKERQAKHGAPDPATLRREIEAKMSRNSAAPRRMARREPARAGR